ncbi:MAG: hypothetical protein IPP71_08545 [Bacteroidetes bacterium]|nr:hypothetical protein [Bacteroidota bacterium]
MAIRNLGAIIVDTLRYKYITKSFEEAGNRNYILDLGCGINPSSIFTLNMPINPLE